MHLPADQLEDPHAKDLNSAPDRPEAEPSNWRTPGLWSERCSEAARWVISFVIVAACHGVGALALMRELPEASEAGVDVPVVMLDLPESLAPSMAPAQDLPPGPVMEDEVPPAPPPKEETKPPEPEAEVALPTPEPPKVERPPAEVVEKTAPPSATKTPPPSVIRWQGRLAAHIQHFQRYPATARTRGESGTATVEFTIDREGRLARSSIVTSSGSAAIDQESLAALVRALPMPRPPDQVTDAELHFIMPMRFNLK